MNDAEATTSEISPQTIRVASTPAPALSKPELLAPAGDWECAKAAVENGADAVYFGLHRFNARMRAKNFTEADLPALMEFLHRRGVRGYVTFNTLVFQNELSDAEQYIRSIISAGVDAAIVQDVGICRAIRRLSPDFPVHASTQMTITSAAGVQFAKDLGCNLVVLARECSLKEIENIQEAQSAGGTDLLVSNFQPGAAGPGPQSKARNSKLPLEVFVHGALCVAYSGQCLTSESLGGRSANRGECAQACRMPYQLISDGAAVPLGDRRYLLSPQDLAGIEVLAELIRAGVASLKIEGRLKSPEYVANITHAYRQAVDRVFADLSGTGDPTTASEDQGRGQASARALADASRYDMEMAFSRGLSTGWFRGINNQELVHARFGTKRGVYLGKVESVQGDKVWLQLEAPLQAGDGVVFDAGHPDQKEEGGRVYEIGQRGRTAALSFGWGDVDLSRVHPGDRVWKTSDPELDRRLRQSFAGEQPNYRRAIALEAHGDPGQVLVLIARDELGHVVRVDSAMRLARAEKRPLDSLRLREQLGRLGGTPFKLGPFDNRLAGRVILPLSELNRMRREFVTKLEALRSRPKRWTFTEHSGLALQQEGVQAQSEIGGKNRFASAAGALPALTPELVVLVRNLPQLHTALRCGISTIYCEFEDPRKYGEAVRLTRTARDCAKNREGLQVDPAIWVAPPRIFKTGEEWILKHVRSCEADGYLVRNYDHLNFFAGRRRLGDFSLNVANALTADYFKHGFHLERLTASYDLNFAQLEALLKAAPAEWFEVTIHQHMPMFHMEHCVFCAFLSRGTNYTNCGRPCDKHDVKLRDRVGAEHPLRADAGCRNTVFNARAQTGADYVARLLALGVRHFRIEFLNESSEEMATMIARYQQLLRGEIIGAQVWKELKLLNQLGVTRGQMQRIER